MLFLGVEAAMNLEHQLHYQVEEEESHHHLDNNNNTHELISFYRGIRSNDGKTCMYLSPLFK